MKLRHDTPSRELPASLSSSRGTVDADFTVVVDRREQAPWTFHEIPERPGGGGRLLNVKRKLGTLATGDYSLLGREGEIAIERKSLADLYSTLSAGRDRFEREHERMAEMRFACVVVEASWERILEGHRRSKLAPASVAGTITAWSLKYRVPWFTVADRRTAELMAFRALAWTARKEE